MVFYVSKLFNMFKQEQCRSFCGNASFLGGLAEAEKRPDLQSSSLIASVFPQEFVMFAFCCVCVCGSDEV